MKTKKLLMVLCTMLLALSTTLLLNTKNVKASDIEPLTISFNDENIEDKLSFVYVSTMYGVSEELDAHWAINDGVIKRINDCNGEDVTGNYAAMYINDSYFKYFELNTKVSYGNNGLTGIVFGKKNIFVRHLADGNALYFMPSPSVELAGRSITIPATSQTITDKDGFFDLKLIVCEDYVKVYVDGKEYLNKKYAPELFSYGKIGLFTANTDGSFSEGVEIYNLDKNGNRIALDEYIATTGVQVKNKTVDINLSDDPIKFEYSVIPENATIQNVRYLSASPDIAIVDNLGYIHGFKEGVTEIFVITEDGAFEDSFILNVNVEIPEIEGVTLNQTKATIDKIGGKVYLNASHYPEEAENQGYKWSTSNSKVAIVNNGTVTAMGEGTCIITVKDYYGNFSATCEVTVKTSDIDDDIDTNKGCKSSVNVLPIIMLSMTALSSMILLKRREQE